MTYILNALIVIPTRFMDRYGWRAATEHEQEATWRFYEVLGERMGIADPGPRRTPMPTGFSVSTRRSTLGQVRKVPP